MAVAANADFKLASVDIRTAFLQTPVLDCDVFIQPPEYIRELGMIWRLKKPLYGLDDVSSKFWLRVKEVLTRMGMKVMAATLVRGPGSRHTAVIVESFSSSRR